MDDDKINTRRFYAVSHNDDSATFHQGALIPSLSKWAPALPAPQVERRPLLGARAVGAMLLIFILSVLAVGTVGVIETKSPGFLASVADSVKLPKKTTEPEIVIENPYTNKQTPLNYGVQVALAEPNFYQDTLLSFIDAEAAFVEIDLTTMNLRYFEGGVLLKTMPILSKGEEDSWSKAPAGLYKIESKEKQYFSSFKQVYQPWSMLFQGNFFIHGEPYYLGGETVSDDYKGSGIELKTADAEALYKLVTIDTPVLVHELIPKADNFVYEPKIPELDTPHYLIADVESSTVLASSDMNATAPIASLTKLMTALVAAEYINLDSEVPVTQPTFVQSLIPRLGERTKVSMYSLLQLLLVESSNEAAEVIAAQIGKEQFVAYMNEKAAALGMTQTKFVDPSGIGAGNTSSVLDLFRLIQYLKLNRSFIVELTKNQDLPTAYVSGEFGQLNNFNKVTDLENFIGGKIGETTAAGQTSVTLHTLTVKGQERTLAIILLGSNSRNADVLELLNYAKERFGS